MHSYWIVLSPALFLIVMNPSLIATDATTRAGGISNGLYAGASSHADDIRTVTSSKVYGAASKSVVARIGFLLRHVEKETFQGEIGRCCKEKLEGVSCIPRYHSILCSSACVPQWPSVQARRKLMFLKRCTPSGLDRISHTA